MIQMGDIAIDQPVSIEIPKTEGSGKVFLVEKIAEGIVGLLRKGRFALKEDLWSHRVGLTFRAEVIDVSVDYEQILPAIAVDIQ